MPWRWRHQRTRPNLKSHGLKPHGVKTFKVSGDPRFELKVRDVAGLYVNPPDHAVVISADEKTQVQALGRTQAPLPMEPGHPETQTHDHTRNGTTCLMAALDVAAGTVTRRMVTRHRSEEFLAFLKHVSEGTEPETLFTSCKESFAPICPRRSTIPQNGIQRPNARGFAYSRYLPWSAPSMTSAFSHPTMRWATRMPPMRSVLAQWHESSIACLIVSSWTSLPQ